MNAHRHLNAPTDGYVFVVTYGRSGSTLTQSLLNAIPGYVIRGENGNLTQFLGRAIDIVANDDMYRWRREDLPKPREERRPYLRPILGKPFDPWAGAERVDPDAFALGLMDLFVKQVLRPPKHCRVSGFKEIRFHEDPAFFAKHMDILRTLFPKSRILFQRRNLDDVARSGWWRQQPRDMVLGQLGQADKMFAAYAQAHPSSCRMIDYEGLISGLDYIRTMYQFLDEPLDEAAVQSVLAHSLKH
ncbi:sulfotransferase [Paracoccus laeviglucosivorans]|uniref:Sulfotransferase family protein n=1 Tax=Paracoccus laeviglucosivorans TaxID=1197861 RepID=A0A521FNQ1_9RHOB|nr:sulfotransferase [Paracoccus laeviglucosivorans]SMO97833.1 Sulfotransferase family protein [Paracoccus laeviglucosivorans]